MYGVISSPRSILSKCIKDVAEWEPRRPQHAKYTWAPRCPTTFAEAILNTELWGLEIPCGGGGRPLGPQAEEADAAAMSSTAPGRTLTDARCMTRRQVTPGTHLLPPVVCDCPNSDACNLSCLHLCPLSVVPACLPACPSSCVAAAPLSLLARSHGSTPWLLAAVLPPLSTTRPTPACRRTATASGPVAPRPRQLPRSLSPRSAAASCSGALPRR